MNNDMIILIVIIGAVLLVLAEVLREVFADRPSHRPQSHYEDPRFRSPGAWN